MTDPQAPTVRLRPEIVNSGAYKQGKPAAADAFKLSSNENPFEPLPSVRTAVSSEAGFNRYPDATAAAVRTALAAKYGVSADEVLVSAGSVAGLAQLISAAAGSGDEVVYAWRSFEAYPGLVRTAGATSIEIPLRADSGHDLPAMAAAVTDRTRVVIVCTPNNPTGTIVTRDEFAAFMASVPSDVLVLLDEAYVEFVTDADAVRGDELFGRYPNLVVLRTFSKAYGLAGLRIGYAIGAAPILQAAATAAIPLAVTGIAQAAAVASLEHEHELFERVGRLSSLRDQLRQALIDQGWNVPEAQGNFFWLATGEQTLDAAEVLDAHGIVARVFAPEGIRISIGEARSIDKLLTATADIVRTLPVGHSAKRLG